MARYPRLVQTVRRLREWLKIWADGITTTPPTFDDYEFVTPEKFDHVIEFLRHKIDGLVTIVERSPRTDQSLRSFGASMTSVMNALRSTYDAPGELRQGGPRHDNDFIDIEDIRIIPTPEELISDIRPFLPTTQYDAPHFFPSGSIQRLLDIQFRLLREELTFVMSAF